MNNLQNEFYNKLKELQNIVQLYCNHRDGILEVKLHNDVFDQIFSDLEDDLYYTNGTMIKRGSIQCMGVHIVPEHSDVK